MNFIFWQNILSPHQAAFLRELAELGHEVAVVATEEMTPDRKSLGWQRPDLGKAEVMTSPSEVEIANLVKRSSDDTVHVLAGARWTPLGAIATKACIANRSRMGLLSEAADPRGLAGIARRVKYTGERIWRGRYYQYVLAMGQLGVDWFSLCGYADDRVFPFGYVTESSELVSKCCQSSLVRFVFVGQLIPRKGLDVLIAAMARIAQAELFIIGSGVDLDNFESLALKCGVSERIKWLGAMDSKVLQKYVVDADVLVLPSREDGWGAVVNESLMAGTPVICTDACGAADLIRHPWLGTVVPAEDVNALAMALSEWCARGKLSQAERTRIQGWSSCITGRSMADYFVGLMQHVYEGTEKPETPWRKKIKM